MHCGKIKVRVPRNLAFVVSANYNLPVGSDRHSSSRFWIARVRLLKWQPLLGMLSNGGSVPTADARFHSSKRSWIQNTARIAGQNLPGFAEF